MNVNPNVNKIRKIITKHQTQILVFVFAILVFFLRKPDAITHAQFYAEDGSQWLQMAINNPHSIFSVLLFSYSGYLVTFQRLVGYFTLLFPLAFGPLIFALIAILVQALPLVYLWSNRCSMIDKKLKIFLTVAYLLIPFSSETHANITNTQWYLAILLFVLSFMSVSKSRLVNIAEDVIIIIISITGPFSIILTPILLYDSWRTKKLPLKYKLVFVGGFIQLISILLDGRGHNSEIGFSITKLFYIVGGQVIGTTFFGARSLIATLSKPWITPIVAVIGTQMIIYVFLKANKTTRYFIIFISTIFFASLFSPPVSITGRTWWEILSLPNTGGRYFLLPHMMVLLCVGWLAFSKSNKNTYLKVFGAVLILLFLIKGAPNDFSYPRSKDLNFTYYINLYKAAPKNSVIVIPINPGHPWKISIIK